MQVFMKPCGNGVFHGSFYRIGGEPGTYALSESGRTSAIISGVTTQLSYTRSRNDSAQRPLADRLVLPVPSIRMGLSRVRRRGIRRCQRNNDKKQLGNPAHSGSSAISLPLSRCE
jgi:hypothetical protein